MVEEHVGLRDLQYQREILMKNLNQITTKTTEKFYSQAMPIAESIVREISALILTNFELIAQTVVQEVFYKNYGANYDVAKLASSVSCYIDTNLCPHMTYDYKLFDFISDFEEDEREFNQNVKNQARIGNFVDRKRLGDYEIQKE